MYIIKIGRDTGNIPTYYRSLPNKASNDFIVTNIIIPNYKKYSSDCIKNWECFYKKINCGGTDMERITNAEIDRAFRESGLNDKQINEASTSFLSSYGNNATKEALESFIEGYLFNLRMMGMIADNTTVEADKEAAAAKEADTNNNELRKVPLPAHNEILRDKKFKYNTFASLMASSNKNIGDVKGMEFTNYLYDNKIKDALDFIYETTGKRISERTFNSHMKNIIDSGYDLVDLQNTPNGLVYLLRAEYDGGYFVTIPFIQLKELLLSTNKNALKIYVFLKDYLKNAKQGEFTPIDRAFIARSIGLSDKSVKNLDAISVILKSLVKLGFIEIKETVKKEVSKKDPSKIQVKTIYAYRICTLAEYLEKDSKAIIKNNN